MGSRGSAVPDGLRLLGLDIGGSASRARLVESGRVTSEVVTSSASLPAAGQDAAQSAFAEMLAGLPLDPARPLDAIGAGSAGLSIPGTREFLLDQLVPLTRPGAVTIVSDAMLVLPAAELAAGVAVICGTGSVAVGSDSGRSVQVGGWGYLLGDEGGGYWIVRETLRVLLRRRDQGCPPGPLGGALLAATGATDVSDLQRLFYEQPHRPRDWSRLAPLVLGSTDPVVTGIVGRAADAVAVLAAAAARDMGWTGPDWPVPPAVVLAGGLMADAMFAATASHAVRTALPAADVRVLADEPVAGAIRLAALTADPAGS
jgi:glucosamine kinase